jgi:hypothetical protein
MSLQQGRSNYGPLDIPLHPTSTTKENTRGYTKTWNLANKQTRSNNQTSELIYKIYKFNRLTNYSGDYVTGKCQEISYNGYTL